MISLDLDGIHDACKIKCKLENSNDDWLTMKSRKVAYKLCFYGNKELNIKIYNEHKRLYYDTFKRSWNQDVVMDNDNKEASSEFSSLSEADYGSHNEDHHNKPVITSSADDFSDAETEHHHPVAVALPMICEPQQDRLQGII